MHLCVYRFEEEYQTSVHIPVDHFDRPRAVEEQESVCQTFCLLSYQNTVDRFLHEDMQRSLDFVRTVKL